VETDVRVYKVFAGNKYCNWRLGIEQIPSIEKLVLVMDDVFNPEHTRIG